MSQAYVFDTNKDVDITVADIVDFTVGIKDPSIFIPPSACNSSTAHVSCKLRSENIALLPTGCEGGVRGKSLDKVLTDT